MGVPARGATGIRVPVAPPSPQTQDVLTDIVMERHRQVQLHGHNEDTPDGTGPDVCWLPDGYVWEADATAAEARIRERYEAKARRGETLTWVDFLLEEMAEAFQEDDPAKLYTELTQVGAVVVSWLEKIRQR